MTETIQNPSKELEDSSQDETYRLGMTILGVRTSFASATLGEANIVQRLRIKMPIVMNNMHLVPCSPTGENRNIDTRLFLYNPSEADLPSIEDVIKKLNHHAGTFRWTHAAKLAKQRDKDIVLAALEQYSSSLPGAITDPDSTVGQGISQENSAREQLQTTNGSPSGSEEVGDDEYSDEEEGKTKIGYLHSQHTEGQAKEALLGETYPLDPLVEATKIREAQYEAARVSIPVISRTYEEEKVLVSRAKTLLEDVARDPMPTSSQERSVDELITAIETQVERIRLGEKLEDGMKALNAERSEALKGLLPSVTRAGEWLEVNGPESRYRYHLPTDEGDLQESSNMRNLDRVGAKGEQDHPVTDLEHSESEAEGDVDGEEASSSDSDLESQLKEWHDGVQSTASGSGVEAEGQTGLQ